MAYKLTYLHRRTGFTTRKVGEAYMIVPTGPRMKEYKGVITVNETAAFLFDQVTEERTADELIEALVKEYEIEPKLAFDALTAFVDQCSFADLLESETVEELDMTRDYFMPGEIVEELSKKYAESEQQPDGQRTDAGYDAPPEPTGDTIPEGGLIFPE